MPNIAVTGTPRSGTTFLMNLIAEHVPDVRLQEGGGAHRSNEPRHFKDANYTALFNWPLEPRNQIVKHHELLGAAVESPRLFGKVFDKCIVCIRPDYEAWRASARRNEHVYWRATRGRAPRFLSHLDKLPGELEPDTKALLYVHEYNRAAIKAADRLGTERAIVFRYQETRPERVESVALVLEFLGLEARHALNIAEEATK